jgi:hypothetical protein
MTELFLGIIAAAVLVMAVIQVAAVVLAARTAKRVDRLADRLEHDLAPIVTNLQLATSEAARVSSLAAAQLERADRLFSELGARAEHILVAVQETLVAPAREGFAWLTGLKAALAAFRDLRESAQPAAPAVDEDDALFIG